MSISAATRRASRRRLSRREWNPDLSWPVGLGLIAPGLALLGLFLLWPLVRLISVSFRGSSTHAYEKLFGSSADLESFKRTFAISALVTLAVIAIGIFLAWEMRTGAPAKRATIAFLVVFPLMTSVVVRNYALIVIFGRRGVINEALLGAGLVAKPIGILYTDTAVAIGMIYTLLPYAVLPLYASFVTIDLDLVRAAQSLGASGVHAFRSVVIPLAVSSIFATAALSFVLSLGFYITPIVLGSANNPFVANRISNSVFVFFDLPHAAAAALVLLGAALLCIGLTLRAVGLERIQRAVAA